jgi:hypothetical protein
MSHRERQNHQRRYQIARAVEHIYAAHLPGHALRDKRRAPYDGNEKKCQVGFEAHEGNDEKEG